MPKRCTHNQATPRCQKLAHHTRNCSHTRAHVPTRTQTHIKVRARQRLTKNCFRRRRLKKHTHSTQLSQLVIWGAKKLKIWAYSVLGVLTIIPCIHVYTGIWWVKGLGSAYTGYGALSSVLCTKSYYVNVHLFFKIEDEMRSGLKGDGGGGVGFKK